ncbi:MAG: AmmeMemoRadiSam system protein B [Fimbriimonadaceae bacterium]|nr:AmmeMemoRadiSam system protein B [Fimbriimonadaceae bacterium]
MTAAPPRLRPLQPTPSQRDGAPSIVWSDPLGLAEAVEVPHAVAVLMTLFDGQRTLPAVLDEWRQMAGEELPLEYLAALVAQCDQHLLLDGGRYTAARDEALAAYRAAGVRPARHCPGGYPAEPTACRAFLDDLLALAPPRPGQPLGLVAPHIDFHRGRRGYAAAYQALRHTAADLFVVLGVGHSSCCWPDPPPLATLTTLDFATPLGTVQTSAPAVDRLLQLYAAVGGDAADLLRDELVHREEHSLEFQMLLLQHLCGHRPFAVLPLLLGSLHSFYDDPANVAGPRGLGPLLGALEALLAEWPGQVVVIAGADLSHVGPRFGGEPVQQADLSWIQDGDHAALSDLAQHAGRFFRHFAADQNARNVCSVANLYVLRALLPEARFALLDHEIAYDPQQTVSFAAAALESLA